jgi:hypothetical protein
MLTQLLTLTIFGSFIWFAILTFILIIAFFVSEKEELGYIATIAVIVYLLLNRFFGNVPILQFITWTNVLSYLGLGFVYTVIRTYFYGRYAKENGYSLNTLKSDLSGNVFRWWFLFPISFIYWMVSDFIAQAWDVIYDLLSNGFEKIFTAGFNSKK